MKLKRFLKQLPNIRQIWLKWLFADNHWLLPEWEVLFSGKNKKYHAFKWKDEEWDYAVVFNDNISEKYSYIQWLTINDDWNVAFIGSKAPKLSWIDYYVVINWKEMDIPYYGSPPNQIWIKHLTLSKTWNDYSYFWRIDADNRDYIENWTKILSSQWMPFLSNRSTSWKIAFLSLKDPDKKNINTSISVTIDWKFIWDIVNHYQQGIAEAGWRSQQVRASHWDDAEEKFWFIIDTVLDANIFINDLGIDIVDILPDFYPQQLSNTEDPLYFKLISDWFEFWFGDAIHRFIITTTSNYTVLQNVTDSYSNKFKYFKNSIDNEEPDSKKLKVAEWLDWEFTEDFKHVIIDWKKFNRKLAGF